MMNYHLIVFALVLLPALVSGQEVAVVYGTVSSHDGSRLSAADVHWYRYKASDSIYRQRVADDGSFEIVTERLGLSEMWFTGVGHVTGDLNLCLEPDDTVTVEYRLPTYDYKPVFDSVGVMVGRDWEKGFEHAVPMLGRKDGMYRARVPSSGDTLLYQLVGIIRTRNSSPRSMNGTQSDRYLYDGGGDYFSILEVEDDTTEIVFDPSTLPSPGEPARSRVECGGCLMEYYHAMWDVVDSGRALSSREEFTALSEKVRRTIPGIQDSLRRQFAMASYFLLSRHNQDSTIAAKMFEEVPPESLIWDLVNNRIFDILRAAGRSTVAQIRAVADPIIAKNTEVNAVTAGYYVVLGANDADSHRQMLIDEYLEPLMTGYPDHTYTKYMARIYNRGPVKVGDPLPNPVREVLAAHYPEVDESIGKGFPVVLKFWASWCGPCRPDWPMLRELYAEYGPDRLRVFGFALESEQALAASQKEGEFWKVNWTNYALEGGFGNALFVKAGGNGIPYSVYIDGNGVVQGLDKKAEYYRGLLEGRVDGTEQ